MKIINSFAFLTSVVLGTILLSSLNQKFVKTENNVQISDTVYVYIEQKTSDSLWNAFIGNLIQVESNGKWDAVGDSNDVGVLQLRPIYVDEVNRILGDSIYSYDDRLDSIKSVEMFNVMQSHYNPTKDLHFALKLHNPKASINYHKRIIKN